MSHKTTAILLLALSAPIVARAETVTYDFTGTVTSASGLYSSIPLGTTITGTYRFALANGVPTGTIGSTTASWATGNSGGFAESRTPPVPLNAYVFTSTAQVGTFSYATSGGGQYSPGSGVGVVVGQVLAQCVVATYCYIANESNQPTQSSGTFSQLQLDSNAPTWSPQGLPVFASPLLAVGVFSDCNAEGCGPDAVGYNITSLAPAPVPLPAAAWLLLSGLGGLGFFGRKRPAA